MLHCILLSLAIGIPDFGKFDYVPEFWKDSEKLFHVFYVSVEAGCM